MKRYTADQFVNLARRKMQIARRHLHEFRSELPSGAVVDLAAWNDSRAELEGHADGCVVQMYRGA